MGYNGLFGCGCELLSVLLWSVVVVVRFGLQSFAQSTYSLVSCATSTRA